MCKRAILIKSVICGSVYLIFPFLVLLAAYAFDSITINPFVVTSILGIICGAIIAFVTNCGELKRTSMARSFGIFAVVIAQLLLEVSDAPTRIILLIYRNDAFVRETGHLTTSETIGYSWSMAFFWFSMSISFIIFCIATFVYNRRKKRRVKKQTFSGRI